LRWLPPCWFASHGAERDLEVLAAERAHVERWMRELEERGRKASTRTGHLSALAGYYAEALDQGAVRRNPAACVRRPRVSHDSPRLGLDRDEARALLRVAERAGRRDHALSPSSSTAACGSARRSR
jgi:integrase/recombinase XerD